MIKDSFLFPSLILTAVDVLLIVDVHLHQSDQHTRENTKELQIRPSLPYLNMHNK